MPVCVHTDWVSCALSRHTGPETEFVNTSSPFTSVVQALTVLPIGKCSTAAPQVAFLFTDAHVADKGFLEPVNSMLTTGMPAGLFDDAEKDALIAGLRDEVAPSRCHPTRATQHTPCIAPRARRQHCCVITSLCSRHDPRTLCCHHAERAHGARVASRRRMPGRAGGGPRRRGDPGEPVGGLRGALPRQPARRAGHVAGRRAAARALPQLRRPGDQHRDRLVPAVARAGAALGGDRPAAGAPRGHPTRRALHCAAGGAEHALRAVRMRRVRGCACRDTGS